MDKYDLKYLKNKPRVLRWKVIAGYNLSTLQRLDLIYDDYDLKIRKLI